MNATESNGATPLAERLNDPKTAESLGRLLDRADQIEQALGKLEKAAGMLDQLPGMMAMMADMFDEWSVRLKNDDDIDLEKAVQRSMHAALWLGQQVNEQELHRLGNALRSHILDPTAVDVVGHAAVSLSKCRNEVCQQGPPRVGLFGLLRALRDPDVQRSLGFALHFAKCFGSGAACRAADQDSSDSGEQSDE